MKALKILHYFIGVGAVFGGLAAVLNPEGPMGISPEVLVNGPFKTFLIPGLFLLLFLGVGNILAGWFTRKKLKAQGYISGMLASGLVFWILIQCYIMQDINILHVIYFFLGAVQGILSLILLVRDRPFPFQNFKKSL